MEVENGDDGEDPVELVDACSDRNSYQHWNFDPALKCSDQLGPVRSEIPEITALGLNLNSHLLQGIYFINSGRAAVSILNFLEREEAYITLNYYSSFDIEVFNAVGYPPDDLPSIPSTKCNTWSQRTLKVVYTQAPVSKISPLSLSTVSLNCN